MIKIFFGFFVGITIVGLVVYFVVFQKNPTTSQNPNTNTQSEVSPSPFSIKEAPSMSLRGKLSIISGEVYWQDRIATQSSIVKTETTIQQGELVETSESGIARLLFENVVDIQITSDSKVEIIQTLPQNLVFNLKKGGISLVKIGENTISIRSLHLLMQIDGNIKVSLDKVEPVVSIKVIDGDTTLAYNNLNFETQSLKISARQTIEFNDSTRKVVAR